LPAPDDITLVAPLQEEGKAGVKITRQVISRKGAGEAVRVEEIRSHDPKEFDGRVVIWVDPAGLAGLWKDGALGPAAHKIIDQKAGILAVEALRTGKSATAKRTPVNKTFAGYTFGYNRPLLSERVHDILTAVALAQKKGAKQIHLVGVGEAGPWVVLAPGPGRGARARAAPPTHPIPLPRRGREHNHTNAGRPPTHIAQQ